ncbi:MAG: RNA pyrophosphohydrolase [Alphaproteobacteria bacterium]|nr:RNA pyrophosphohydrolase [Alphaproteobacteria bacterium]
MTAQDLPDINSLPYRPCVGIMLLNKRNQVFVAKRIDTRAEAWQMPQGGIDEGETAEHAAMREMYEEIGTRNATIIATSTKNYHYDLPVDLVPNLWGGKFRGQTQQWFVLRFNGTDDDINIVTENPEFSEWKWVDMKQLPDLIVPFKRQLYQQLVEKFGYLAA